jgi:hypothetical protein
MFEEFELPIKKILRLGTYSAKKIRGKKDHLVNLFAVYLANGDSKN